MNSSLSPRVNKIIILNALAVAASNTPPLKARQPQRSANPSAGRHFLSRRRLRGSTMFGVCLCVCVVSVCVCVSVFVCGEVLCACLLCGVLLFCGVLWVCVCVCVCGVCFCVCGECLCVCLCVCVCVCMCVCV